MNLFNEYVPCSLILFGSPFSLSKRVNTHGYTFQQVVDHVIADTDTNHDGLVSFTEFNVELLGQFDLDGKKTSNRIQRLILEYKE